jgi:hypothetical protein
VKRKINLVYGGGSVGLMGLISQTVYEGGCHVLGLVYFPYFSLLVASFTFYLFDNLLTSNEMPYQSSDYDVELISMQRYTKSPHAN